jgi:aminotransferase
MEHLIQPKVKQIEISGIRKMANKVSQYDQVLSLTIGQPDFPTPGHILEAAKIAMDQGKTVYTPNAGLLELRRAASHFVKEKYNLYYEPEDEILVTVGASEALDITLRTILEQGSEVLLPGPIYPGYAPLIEMYGGSPVYMDTTNHGFKLTAELLSPYLTDKTRCIVLASPSNPTGAVLSQEELADIANLLRNREIFVISDEIYSELVYDGQHHSIASQPGMRDKTIVINGLSKSHSMTGWRIGFTFAPAYLTKHMVKVHQYHVTCASSISQYAALAALTAGIDDAVPMRSAYMGRRDFVYNQLVAAGFEVQRPGGAFYIFPSIRKFGMNSTDFAHRLLAEQRVAVVPGDAFSPLGDGYIRISYVSSMDVLEQSMRRLSIFVNSI